MPRPTTKAELLDACAARHAALLRLLDGASPTLLAAPFAFDDRDRCVRDVLGHLHEWHLMMLDWYEVGMAGGRPSIPAPGYTWRTLPALNAEVWARCQERDLHATRTALEGSYAQVLALVAAHSDDELFTKRRYAWTGTTSLGAYLVSSTCSHDDWAIRKLRRHLA